MLAMLAEASAELSRRTNQAMREGLDAVEDASTNRDSIVELYNVIGGIMDKLSEQGIIPELFQSLATVREARQAVEGHIERARERGMLTRTRRKTKTESE